MLFLIIIILNCFYKGVAVLREYVLKNRQGQFFMIGIIFIILGYIFMPTISIVSKIMFYFAIFFLGFFASKSAVIDTIKSKSPNVDLLMILAALGAVIIQYESEGALLLLIFAGAEVLEEYATNKSSNSISSLMSQVPSTAQVLLENGEVIEKHTDDLVIGETVIVSKGEQIPIDGTIDRRTMVNEAALTGESLPVAKEKGDEVFAGTINEDHVFNLKVGKLSSETIFSNIIRMVETAQNRPSKVSKFIDRIESKYVISVLVIVPIFILILYYLSGFTFSDAFYRGMILLTVASPCALIAAVTPATLSAISNGAKKGVLFKGGAAMEALSTIDTLYSDKTGTLTYGEFKVVDYALDDKYLKEVVYMEQQSSHPIAQAIVAHFKSLDLSQIDAKEPVEEMVGSGMKKGQVIIGKPSVFKNYQDENGYFEKVAAGHTTIMVGFQDKIIGYFSLADQVRQEASAAVQSFQKDGVHVALLTGDNNAVAKLVSKEVGIADYTAACLPEDKINYIEESQSKQKVVGMIGDGINDAPALANADIGIAMGSGSSVAMESADIVIVKNNLLKLYHSFELSRKLNRIIIQNVVFALAVIIILILLNIFGYLDLPMGVVFHEGSTILVILNGLRLLKDDQTEKVKLKKVSAEA